MTDALSGHGPRAASVPKRDYERCEEELRHLGRIVTIRKREANVIPKDHWVTFEWVVALVRMPKLCQSAADRGIGPAVPMRRGDITHLPSRFALVTR